MPRKVGVQAGNAPARVGGMEENMRPFGIDEDERLRLARARAEELRVDWRQANGPSASERPEAAARARGGIIETARFGAGRTLIGLGTLLLPRNEPCA